MTLEVVDRDINNRVGNWHDTVDGSGNGSAIAILKSLLAVTGNGVGTYFNNPTRDLRNRIGNWNDDVDNNGNGSLIALIKHLPTLVMRQPFGAVNVMYYIPSIFLADIIAGISTVDVTQYLNLAHQAAGIGGAVYYPKGFYTAANVAYLDQQKIFGDGLGSTFLSKVKAGFEALDILVPYNWLHDITGLGVQGVTIRDMCFVADVTSTGGAAIVLMSRRAKIQEISITGPAPSSGGIFGGIYPTTYTKGFKQDIIDVNIAGAHIDDTIIFGCSLGAIFARSTFVTAIIVNTSITLSRNSAVGLSGPGVYTDIDGNFTFNGTSNGTNVILVANTAGIIVGDQIEGPDVITDLITDLFMTDNNITNCGSLDGTTAAIDSSNMAGWHIHNNKIQNCPNRMLNCNRGAHSLSMKGNHFDVAFNNPIAGNNIAINITCDRNGLNDFSGNIIKSRNIGDLTHNYIMVNWDLRHDSSQGNACSNNLCDMPDAMVGTFTAFKVVDPANNSGVAVGNSYWKNLTAAQRGNIDSVWVPNITESIVPQNPPFGWTEPYPDPIDHALKVKNAAGTVRQLAAP